jgi:hypothetical protein
MAVAAPPKNPILAQLFSFAKLLKKGLKLSKINMKGHEEIFDLVIVWFCFRSEFEACVLLVLFILVDSCASIRDAEYYDVHNVNKASMFFVAFAITL